MLRTFPVTVTTWLDDAAALSGLLGGGVWWANPLTATPKYHEFLHCAIYYERYQPVTMSTPIPMVSIYHIQCEFIF